MSLETTVWVRSIHLEEAFDRKEAEEEGGDLKAVEQKYDLVKKGAITSGNPNDWGWVRVAVLPESSMDGKTKTLRVHDEDSEHSGEVITIPVEEGMILSANEWEEVERRDSDLPPNDLINLTHLHEAALVYCLRRRYAVDEIYTNTGRILLALNPFKRLDLYSDESMKKYYNQGLGLASGDLDGSPLLPPHCYEVAGRAYLAMQRALEAMKFGRSAGGLVADQSILVSGESGAGKTVTTKFVMAYLAFLSEKSKVDDNSESGGIEEQVLKSNPILESFGNARTTRNDNSSRFGKFIKIQFSKNGNLKGASIDTYLLEKVRIMVQAPGERNYHIFYEVLQGLTDEEREEFELDEFTAEDFKMTSSGTYNRRDGVEDHETFEDLQVAMETLGFSEKSRKSILSLTCALLNASNLTLRAMSADESELEDDNPFLEPTLKLLGVTRDALNHALCKFSIKAGRDTYIRSLPKLKAERALDALIKGTYAALFNYLVQQVNSKIKQNRSANLARRRSLVSGSAALIGLLDIFGFESFKKNSFEQLCINYCNEALQQQFNQYVFKSEQEIYKQEGINWSFITFPDNQDALDLIDKKGAGILPILDDQVRTVGGTDKSFANDLYRKCTDHPRFSASKLQVGSRKFELNHYAGGVEYDTEGFVSKNKDEFPREASDLLESSTNLFVKKLAKSLSPPVTEKSSGRGRKPQRQTVGGQFISQLQDLRETISSTSPHYIRCIKPNAELVRDSFNPVSIVEQLRCAGVLEAIRVARAGFPQRFDHVNFLAQYSLLAVHEVDAMNANLPSAKILCKTIVSAVSKTVWEIEHKDEPKKKYNASNIGIQVGGTKVFLRSNAYEILERLRVETLGKSAIFIQAGARRFNAMNRYNKMKTSIIIIQSVGRVVIARQLLRKKRQYKASIIVQKYSRSLLARSSFLKMKYVALWCQKYQKGKAQRKRFTSLLEQYRAVIIIQCLVRSKLACTMLKQLKANEKDLGHMEEERNRYKREADLMKQQMLEAERKREEEMQRELELMKEKAEEEARLKVEEESKARATIVDASVVTGTIVEAAARALATEVSSAELPSMSNEEVEKLEKSLEEAYAETETLKAEIAKLKNGLERVTDEINGKDKRAMAATSALAAYEAAAAIQSQRNATRTKIALQNAQREAMLLLNRSEEGDDEVDDQIAEYEVKISQLKREHGKHTRDNRLQNERANTVNNVPPDEMLSSALKELREELDLTKVDLEDMSTHADQSKVISIELDNLKQRLQDITKERDEAHREAAKSSDIVKAVTLRLSEVEKLTIVELEKKAEEATIALEQAKTDNTAALNKEHEAKIKQLIKESEMAREEVKQGNDRIIIAQAALAASEQTAQQVMEELMQDVADSKSEADKLRISKRKANAEVSKLRKEVESLKAGRGSGGSRSSKRSSLLRIIGAGLTEEESSLLSNRSNFMATIDDQEDLQVQHDDAISAKELSKSREKNMELQSRIDQLVEDRDEARRQAARESERALVANTRVAQAEASTSILLIKKAQETKAALEKMQNEAQVASESETTTLRENLALLNEQNEKAQKEAKEYNERALVAKASLASSETASKNLIVELKKESDEAKAVIEKLRQNEDTSSKQILRLREEVSALKGRRNLESEEMSREAESIKADLERLEAQLGTDKSLSATGDIGQITKLEKQITDLTEERDRARREANIESKRALAATIKLAKSEAAATFYLEQRAKDTRLALEKAQRLVQEKCDTSDNSDDIMKLEGEITMLKDEHEKAQHEAQAGNERVTVAQAALAASEAAAKKTTTEFVEEVDKLRTLLEQSKLSERKAFEEIQKLQQDLSEMSQSAQTEITSFMELKENHSKLQLQYEDKLTSEVTQSSELFILKKIDTEHRIEIEKLVEERDRARLAAKGESERAVSLSIRLAESEASTKVELQKKVEQKRMSLQRAHDASQNAAESERAGLAKDVAKFSKELEAAKDEADKENNRAEDAQKTLEESKIRAQVLMDSVVHEAEEIRKALHKARAAEMQSEQEIKRLWGEMDSLTEKHNITRDALMSELTETKTKLETIQDKLNENGVKEEEASAEYMSQQVKISELNEALRKARREVAAKNERVLAANARLTEVEAAANIELRKKVKESRSALLQAQHKQQLKSNANVKELQLKIEEIEELKREHKEALGKASEGEQQLESAQTAMDAKLIELAKASNVELQRKVEETKSALLQAQHEEKEKSDVNTKELQYQIEELKKMHEEALIRVSEGEQRLASATSGFDAKLMESEAAANVDLQKKVEDSRRSLLQAQHKQQLKSDANTEELQLKIEELKRKHEEAQNEANEGEQRLESAQAAMHATEKASKKMIEDLMEETETAYVMIDELKRAERAALNQVTKLQREIQALSDEDGSTKSQVRSLERERDKAIQDAKDANAKYNVALKEIGSLKDDLKNSKKKMRTINENKASRSRSGAASVDSTGSYCTVFNWFQSSAPASTDAISGSSHHL